MDQNKNRQLAENIRRQYEPKSEQAAKLERLEALDKKGTPPRNDLFLHIRLRGRPGARRRNVPRHEDHRRSSSPRYRGRDRRHRDGQRKLFHLQSDFKSPEKQIFGRDPPSYRRTAEPVTHIRQSPQRIQAARKRGKTAAHMREKILHRLTAAGENLPCRRNVCRPKKSRYRRGQIHL